MIVDPFAGPGGWSEGLRTLGLEDIGYEFDRAACATRAAAGHTTVRADVRQVPLGPLAGKCEGLILSPPCQAFSSAGKGDGRGGLAALRTSIDQGDWSARGPGHEVLEVGRWAETLRPAWVACEQVPPVLPLWQAYAARWRRLFGWSTWAGLLLAADFGVPQTRTRAFLLASADRTIEPPAPTHCKDGGATLFGDLAPWVSMARALGWTGEDTQWMVRTGANSMVTGRTGSRAGDGDVQPYERPVDRPSPTVDSKVGQWQLNRRQQNPDGSPVPPVPPDQPAPTLTVQAGASSQWQWERPATTIAGDPRITARCHHNAGTQGANPKTTDQVRAGDYDGTEPIKLTLAEALILQSFPPDYPVQGNKSEQFTQVGNAVPPLMAAHVVSALTGISL